MCWCNKSCDTYMHPPNGLQLKKSGPANPFLKPLLNFTTDRLVPPCTSLAPHPPTYESRAHRVVWTKLTKFFHPPCFFFPSCHQQPTPLKQTSIFSNHHLHLKPTQPWVPGHDQPDVPLIPPRKRNESPKRKCTPFPSLTKMKFKNAWTI